MEDFTIGCRQPDYHEGKWLLLTPFGKAGSPVCLACCVLTLEDPGQLAGHKQFVLGGVLDILHSAPELIVKVIAADDKVAFRIITVILDFTRKSEENLASMAAECVLLLLYHMKSESLGLAVVKGLITRIQQECNYQQSVLQFQMLGRLLQNSPDLTTEILRDRGDFLRYMANGIAYPCDKVKCTIIVTLVRVYQSSPVARSDILLTVHSEVLSKLLAVLKNSHERDVLKCALALLTSLLRKVTKTLDLLMQNRSENVDFVSSMKKILLSNDAVLQTCAVQCICCIVQSHSTDGSYITLFLDASIPEFLFEILCTTNELLIESALTCISLFTRHSLFFAKNHEIYGVETLIRLTDQLLSVKNWKLSLKSIQLLSVMFSSSKNSVSVMPHDTTFKQTVQLLEKALQHGNQILLVASSHLLSKFLRKENLPNPMPFSLITNLANMCMTAMCKFLLTNDRQVDRSCLQQLAKECYAFQNGSKAADLPKEFKLLEAGLQVVRACTRLAGNYTLDPCARESTFSCPSIQSVEGNEPSLESQTSTKMNNLTDYILASLDVVFLPYILFLGTASDLGRQLCAHVLNILSEIYELFGWQDCEVLQGLTSRLIKAGFIRLFWNNGMLTYSSFPQSGKETMKSICCSVLKWLLWSSLKQDKTNEQYLNIIKTGVEQFDDSFESSSAILLQKCNIYFDNQQDLKCAAAQITFIFVCYTSFLHADQIIAVDILLPNLICFMTLNSENKTLPRIVLKHLVFLFALCTHEAAKRNSMVNAMIANVEEADSMIRRIVRNLPSAAEVYTHHMVLLWWCFRNEEHTALSHYALTEWLKCCIPSTEIFEAEPEVLLTLTKFFSKNRFVQTSFLTGLGSADNSFSKRAYIFLHLMGKCEDIETDFKRGLEEFFIRIMQYIPAHLVNILMRSSGNDDDQLHDSLPVLFDILLWCQKQFPNYVTNSDVEAKLAFHATNLCTKTSLPDRVLISCLGYLCFILWNKKDSQSHKVWNFLVGNKKFSATVQNCLKLKGDGVHLEALRLVVAMMQYQKNYGIQAEAQLKVSAKELFQWLNSASCDLQSLTLKALRYLIKMGFQNSVLEIVREMNFFSAGADESVTKFSGNDFRILFTSLLNLVTKHKPAIDEDAVPCLTDLLEFLHEKYPDLERHLMMQPWVRIGLGNRLVDSADIDRHTWNLFDKWLTYPKVNHALITAVQHLAKEISVRDTTSAEYTTAALKICHSPYHKYLPESTKQNLLPSVHNKNESQESDSHSNEVITQPHHVDDDSQRLVTFCIEPPVAHKSENALNKAKDRSTDKGKSAIQRNENNELLNEDKEEEKSEKKKKKIRMKSKESSCTTIQLPAPKRQSKTKLSTKGDKNSTENKL